MSEEPNEQMSELEYLRAMFFCSDEEFAALAKANNRLRAKAKASNRAVLKRRAEMQALRRIVRGFSALKIMGEAHLVAALGYVNNRYGKTTR